jgi:excisionase family DNA binding protein
MSTKRNAQPMPEETPTAQQEVMTVSEVATLLKIPRSSIYEKTRRRTSTAPPLPARRCGKYLRFFRSEVMAWLTALPLNNAGRRAGKIASAASYEFSIRK